MLPARGAGDWSVIIASPALVPSLSGDVTSIPAGGALQVFLFCHTLDPGATSPAHPGGCAVPRGGAALDCRLCCFLAGSHLGLWLRCARVCRGTGAALMTHSVPTVNAKPQDEHSLFFLLSSFTRAWH